MKSIQTQPRFTALVLLLTFAFAGTFAAHAQDQPSRPNVIDSQSLEKANGNSAAEMRRAVVVFDEDQAKKQVVSKSIRVAATPSLDSQPVREQGRPSGENQIDPTPTKPASPNMPPPIQAVSAPVAITAIEVGTIFTPETTEYYISTLEQTRPGTLLLLRTRNAVGEIESADPIYIGDLPPDALIKLDRKEFGNMARGGSYRLEAFTWDGNLGYVYVEKYVRGGFVDQSSPFVRNAYEENSLTIQGNFRYDAAIRMTVGFRVVTAFHPGRSGNTLEVSFADLPFIPAGGQPVTICQTRCDTWMVRHLNYYYGGGKGAPAPEMSTPAIEASTVRTLKFKKLGP